MKQKKLFAILGLAVLALFAAAYADDSDKDKLVPYRLLKTITIPEGLVGFDISWVDSEAGRYYLANRGNVTATPPVNPTIDVIDAERDKFLYAIPLHGATLATSGGNGVIAIRKSSDDDEQDDPGGQLWVGLNDSTVKVIDLTHPFATPLSISTGGTMRADELAYDPTHHILLVANDRDPKPFVTFISTTSHLVLGKIVYDGTLGNPNTTGGIEQPVWNGVTKRFYISIPSTVANPAGEVDEINPVTQTIKRIFPTTCGPAGLALIPGQRLMTSCGDVLSVATGAVVHTVAGVGGDEIWFNSGDERVYFGGDTDRTSVPVVNAVTPYNVITKLVVGFLVPPPSHTTHSVAADSQNNHIFVPVTLEGVKVYTDDRDNGEGPDN